jgi:hypothetical protein
MSTLEKCARALYAHWPIYREGQPADTWEEAMAFNPTNLDDYGDAAASCVRTLAANLDEKVVEAAWEVATRADNSPSVGDIHAAITAYLTTIAEQAT